MGGPSDSDRGGRPRTPQGHRALPHTADVRIEAWAPTSAECVAEAVRAMVEGFADLSQVAVRAAETLHIDPGPPEDQLVTALDEVIYRMETAGRVPRSVEARENQAGLWLRLGMADLAAVRQIGAVPKAVTLHGLRCSPEPGGWVCQVTLDV